MQDDHHEIYETFLRSIEEQSIDAGTTSAFWQAKCEHIKNDARLGNRNDFLRWPSLNDFSVPESWIPAECYSDLRESEHWDRRWFPLLRDSKLGTPKDFTPDFGTSPILVQHAYHLMRYERATGRSLLDCDVIFEVGGGYGSFCRLLKNAGFDGLHFIYDLPYVSSIQRLFLRLSGFHEVSLPEIASKEAKGFCLITDKELDATFDRIETNRLRVGFVATWSLSECPQSVRARIFPRFHEVCDRYLIAFQPTWEGLDNQAYFSAESRARPDLTWHRADMPRIIVPPSLYLFA